MQLDQRHDAGQHQTATLNISAKLIASVQLLQLSSQELEQAIANERDANPALEADEKPQCFRCAAPLIHGWCPNCGSATAASGREDGEIGYGQGSLVGGADEDEVDAMTRVSARATLEESLLSELCAQLPTADWPIAESLVGNLNSHGYLDATVDEIAADVGAPVERVEAALAILQTLEPCGIGARSLIECLLIQLQWLREQGQPQPLAEQIVAHHLVDVGARRFIEVGQALGVRSKEVIAAWHIIRTQLNPYPAHAAPGDRGSNQVVLARPDVVIRSTDMGFVAEVVERGRYQLGLDPTYRMVAGLRHGQGVSTEERQQVRQYAARAQFFIDCIRQRWDTLQKIADALITSQADFLANGVQHLKPLTRSQIADQLGLHESTISRATNQKYVLLPDGSTVLFDEFFDGSLRAKAYLQELIAAEDPLHPLSDDQLTEQLGELGIPVARRTVAKYRDALRIPPSRLRATYPCLQV